LDYLIADLTFECDENPLFFMQMIIANTLAEGLVVFLTADAGWTPDIAAGAIANSDEEAAELLAQAKQSEKANQVIDPYLIPVATSIIDGSRQPTEYREFIRATGPTVPIPGSQTGHP
jgi:hypothetical protein